jgi:hypothetical protein
VAHVMKRRSLVNSGRRRRSSASYGSQGKIRGARRSKSLIYHRDGSVSPRPIKRSSNAGKFSRRRAKQRFKKTVQYVGSLPKSLQPKRWYGKGVKRRTRNGRVNVTRRRNAGKKRMTAKQIKYFGTARQRAALRLSNRRKKNRRNYGTVLGRSWSAATAAGRSAGSSIQAFRKSQRSKGITYRQTKRGRKRGRLRNTGIRRRRKNVSHLLSVGLAGGNPGRKRRRNKRSKTTMARRRNRRMNRRNTSHRRRYYVRRNRRANTGSYRRRRYNRHHHRMHNRRRNQGLAGGLGEATGMLKNAIAVISGAVGTRYVTSLALGANNTGAIGYLANAVAALALGWAAGKMMKNPQIGSMVALGGFTALALRMLSDLTPIGQYVNLSLSGVGKRGDVGIGMITDSYFPVPTVWQSGSMTQAQIPTQITQLLAAGSTKQAGVGAMRRRRAY